MLKEIPANLTGNSHAGGSLSMVLPKAPIMFCQMPKYLPEERGPEREIVVSQRKQVSETPMNSYSLLKKTPLRCSNTPATVL